MIEALTSCFSDVENYGTAKAAWEANFCETGIATWTEDLCRRVFEVCNGSLLGRLSCKIWDGRILEVPSHQACIMGWVPPPNIINVPYCLPFFHNTSMFSFCQKALLMKDMKKLHLTYRHSPAVNVGRVRSYPHFCKGVVTDCSKVATQHGDASHVESGQ